VLECPQKMFGLDGVERGFLWNLDLMPCHSL